MFKMSVCFAPCSEISILFTPKAPTQLYTPLYWGWIWGNQQRLRSSFQGSRSRRSISFNVLSWWRRKLFAKLKHTHEDTQKYSFHSHTHAHIPRSRVSIVLGLVECMEIWPQNFDAGGWVSWHKRVCLVHIHTTHTHSRTPHQHALSCLEETTQKIQAQEQGEPRVGGLVKVEGKEGCICMKDNDVALNFWE